MSARLAAIVSLWALLCGAPGFRAVKAPEVGTISGTVTDSSGVPLHYAAVIVEDTVMGTLTYANGGYTLTNVPAGQYSMHARLIGYAEARSVGVHVQPGRTTVVDFRLARGGRARAPEPPGPPLVQVGVRSEAHGGTCTYIYTVLNRSRVTITALQVGYDKARGVSELTGARPHVPPDTAYSPRGWACVPLQAEDPSAFTLGWGITDTLAQSGGIPPHTLMSGFTVTLSRPDALYERCHWLVRFNDNWAMTYHGEIRPASELDAACSGRGAAPYPIPVGAVSGTVMGAGGEPIPSATVTVQGARKGAITAADGRYKIAGLPTGPYNVRARLGRRASDWAPICVLGGDTTRVDLSLKERPVSGRGIVR